MKTFKQFLYEGKFNKRKLLQMMKSDTGMIYLDRGVELSIDKTDKEMWHDDVVFALDQDGGEVQVKYKDIVDYQDL